MSLVTPLITRDGIPPAVPDDRKDYEKQRAKYIILASTLFERMAFYSLAVNLVIDLNSSQLNWDSTSSTTISLIFFGMVKNCFDSC